MVDYDHIDAYISYCAVPNAQVLGRQFGREFKEINSIRALEHQDILKLMMEEKIEISGHTILLQDIFVRCQPIDETQVNTNGQIRYYIYRTDP